MAHLQHIKVLQFKNHLQWQHAFSKKVVGICGANGTGKTNLLDAIYYLCFTKSYFAATDAVLVCNGTQGFRLDGHFQLDGSPAQVRCILRENGKKEMSWNEETYSRVSAHIGRLPAVIIAPDDVDLITGGSETRRRMIDAILCQINAPYLQQLMEYNKLLQQRNSLLKQMAEAGIGTHTLLDVFDDQLADRGSFIAYHRHQMLGHFLPKAEAHYHLIAGHQEPVQFGYQTSMPLLQPADGKAFFLQLLQTSRAKDMAVQRTTAGIHRDDLQLLLAAQPFKLLASQGQRKSLLFALKLTEYEWLQQHKGFAPILLLDDVFEKLDNLRMTNLLHEVCVEKQGQVFITDTHRQRLHDQLQNIGADFEIIEIG